MMKKTMGLLLALLLIFPNAVLGEAPMQAAENGMNAKIEAETTWFELEEGALRVSLPANPSTGYAWQAEASDPAKLSLVSESIELEDAPEGMVGAGGMWRASFAAAKGGAGAVVLTLRYARSWEAEPAQTHTICLWIGQSGAIEQILSAR